MADPNANGKTNRFVGICIQRGGTGLGATFILRNIINKQGESYWFSVDRGTVTSPSHGNAFLYFIYSHSCCIPQERFTFALLLSRGSLVNVYFFMCHSGVEICFELYNPRLQIIEVLKLEKRLDDNLMYLRDALPEYSTVDPDMKPVPSSPTGQVPVNKVRENDV